MPDDSTSKRNMQDRPVGRLAASGTQCRYCGHAATIELAASIEGETIHALCAPCLIFEAQEQARLMVMLAVHGNDVIIGEMARAVGYDPARCECTGVVNVTYDPPDPTPRCSACGGVVA